MSKGIRMALVMNLLPLLFLPALIRADQNMAPLITFKLNENVTYDCIDIYKQPGLDHPLLKNHKIQMEPSISRDELKNQTGVNKIYMKKLGCPDGTVPILKNSKEYITNASQSGDSPAIHNAGIRSNGGPYRGVEASFTVHKVNVGKDQDSYANVYVGRDLKNQVNFIQAGWMINPNLYGDAGVWSYGFWKGKDGKGCFNTLCPGFVQVSQEVPLIQPLGQLGEASVRYSIHQDKQTGNWWITKVMPYTVRLNIGYWPKELFNLMDNGANVVGVGGVVQTRLALSPPMGNGKFPTEDRKESATFTNIEVVNSNYELRRIDYFPIEQLLDSPRCYGLRTGQVKQLGFSLNYGGPGGNSC